MARINPDLFAHLKEKLGVGSGRVYALIEAKVHQTHLPRHLAAIALASENRIGISKFASETDLATLRNALGTSSPAPVVVPQLPPLRSPSRKGKSRKPVSSRPRRPSNTVFVVHGRNMAARDAMFAFLRAIGLKPLEWNKVIQMTGESSPYVGKILETAFREAAAVVVLLTPDDEVRLREKFWLRSDPAHERRITGQARPNVLFEAGMALGGNPKSTVLVQIGKVKPFSDTGGRHVVHMNNSPTKRRELVTKLHNAGCEVDIEGTDWLGVGDFTEN